MPDGIEWPRYKSGGPVGIGGRFTDRAGIERTVASIRFYDSDFSIYSDDGTSHYYSYGEAVAPAPVLAADGEPPEEGQTVWDTNGDELVIGALEDGGHTVTCRYVDVGDAIPVYGMWSPSDLTHQRPEIKCRDCAHWQKDPTADNMGVCWFFYHEYEGQDCYPARLGDIGACEEFMPRARALAERERGE